MYNDSKHGFDKAASSKSWGKNERQINGLFSQRKNKKLIKIIRNSTYGTQVFENEAKATKEYQEMLTFLV